MCAGCWIDRFESAKIDNDAVREAAKAIALVYEQEGGICGGNLHCEIDDWNIEDGFFKNKEFEPYNPDVPIEQLLAEQACFDQLKALSEAERASALALYDGYWQ